MKRLFAIFLSLLLLAGCGKTPVEPISPEDRVIELDPIPESELETVVTVTEPESEPQPQPQPEPKPEPADTSFTERHDWYFSGIPASVDELCAKYGAYYRSGRDERVIYLTFDEGYENGYTSVILDTLKEKGVTAAFFVTGSYVKQNPELIQRMADEGHIVGNHTVNHPAMSSLDEEGIKKEILGLEEQLKAFGISDRYVRPPEGAYSEHSLKVTQELGYKTVFWHFAYRDWVVDDQKGKDFAYEKIVGGAKPGGIMLLHAVSKDNAEALGDAIDTLRAQGWSFQSLEQL